nr:hypothetical protein [Tanacetum cinerariifolium]
MTPHQAFTIYKMETGEVSERLCLKHEVKNGDKVVTKELIVTLKDDWELILDGIDFGDIPDIDNAELPPFRGSQTDELRNNYAKSLKGRTYGNLERCAMPSWGNYHFYKVSDSRYACGQGSPNTCWKKISCYLWEHTEHQR